MIHLSKIASLLIVALGMPLASHGEAASENVDPRLLATIPFEYNESSEVESWQSRLAANPQDATAMQRLGWVFHQAYRSSQNPAFCSLALVAGESLQAFTGWENESFFLQAYSLLALHRFEEADSIARTLVEQRGDGLDYALLGDICFDLGRAEEALSAYLKMGDIIPGHKVYGRLASWQWLYGDPREAIRFADLAIAATSGRKRDSLTWYLLRALEFRFETGAPAAELLALGQSALKLEPNSAQAHYWLGRVLLGEGRAPEAIDHLRQSVERNPMPMALWALAESYREAGCADKSEEVESQLIQRSGRDDPRSFSLYLATAGNANAEALSLAKEEYASRQDPITADRLAWALLRSGAAPDALKSAGAIKFQTARTLLHQGLIALENHLFGEARRSLQQANALKRTLLPSEARLLDVALASIDGDAGAERSKQS